MKQDYHDSWKSHLNEEESEAFSRTLQWERSRNGIPPMNAFGLSLAREAEKTFPEAAKMVKEKTGLALKRVRDYARLTINDDAISDKIAILCGRAMADNGTMEHIPVSLLDGVAKDIMTVNVIAAGTEGALTGATGLLGFALDLPLIYAILFRLIEEIALCYGYSIDKPEEKLYILKILELGHQVDGQSRNEAITDLYTLHTAIRGGVSLNQIERSGIMKGFQSFCERLGISFSKRRLSTLFIIIGGIAGGAMNYILAREIADAAYHTYRKRFLMDRAMARQLNRI